MILDSLEIGWMHAVRIDRTPGQTPAVFGIPPIDEFQFLDEPMASSTITFGLVLKSD